ncbi:MAG: TIGR01906 family membrane protein [Dehalococcoidia bacterium]|nr:MAG: TIGR01906 family membrane protein [Dehalococcoidia bacterium]
MNAVRLISRWIFIVFIPILLLSATLAWAFNSLWIYKAGFAKYEVGQALGLSPAELDKSARELIAYFNNTRQELLDINVTYDTGETAPLLNQDDVLHMKDVKKLVWLDYRLFVAAVVYSILYILSSLAWNRRHGRRDLAMGVEWGGGATVALLCFLGVFAVTSFDWFFTTFHEIFFPQGNWQFPPGDHMITLFPDGFWSDVTLLVGLVTLGLALAVGALGLVWLRRIKKMERIPAQS